MGSRVFKLLLVATVVTGLSVCSLVMSPFSVVAQVAGPSVAVGTPMLGSSAPIGLCVPAAPKTTNTPLGCGSPTCGGTMDNPHYSSGGILAKAHFYCDPGVTSVSYILYLFKCGSDPTGHPESTWESQYGCEMQYVVPGGISSPPESSTRYVPAAGVAHGTGWWIACNAYSYVVAGVEYGSFLSPSKGAYLSA